MGFDNADAWGRKYIDMIDRNRLSEGKTFDLPRFEDNALWFRLNEKQMDIFEKATKVEEQELVLKNFLDEVINYPEQYSQN